MCYLYTVTNFYWHLFCRRRSSSLTWVATLKNSLSSGLGKMALAAYNMTFASTVDFRLSLDLFDSGLYTCASVARLTLALAKLSCCIELVLELGFKFWSIICVEGPEKERCHMGREWGCLEIASQALPSRLGAWGSIVSSPSGVHGTTPAENGFGCILS